MVRATGWRPGLLAVALVAVGCQAGSQGTPLALAQAPPTIQAVVAQDYGDTVIHGVTRQARGGQDYYTVRFDGSDGCEHSVVYNEAGDQVDKH